MSPPRGPMFQNDRTNFLWTVLQYLKPQYVTATTRPVVCSPPLLFTQGNKSKHRHRRMRDYIGSLGEAGIFSAEHKKKQKKNCDAADFLFLHLYLLYISSTLNDVIGLRRQSLNLEVFFPPRSHYPSPPPLGSNHIIRLRHQRIFPAFWRRSTVSPQRSRIRTSESFQHTQSPGDFVEANSQNSGTIVVK